MAASSDSSSLLLKHLTFNRVQQLIVGIVVLYTLYILLGWVYNVYFHPLSTIPGPKLAAATPLYSGFYNVTGRRHKWNAYLHSKYGEEVRVGPNTLSFINETAWKDIYMHRQGQQHRQMQKAFSRRSVNGAWSIISAPDDVHARLRRGLSHAFSEKALREQEPLIKKYVDLLVKNLREDARAGREVDMVAYLNFLTFDLIGDLAFAAPFGALETRTAHPWMRTFFKSIKTGQYIFTALLIPPLRPIITFLAPTLRKVQRRQFGYCVEKVNNRIESGSERPDLMSEVLKANEVEEPGKGMSREEIQATFDILMIAGSETTATLLSGCFSLLMGHPAVYNRLKKEVRGAFATDDEITVVKVNSLPYLLAVLEESLRIYPPVPVALNRIVPPDGASICGRWVPAGTVVGIPQYAANHSPVNFVDPDTFCPERFMSGKHPEFEGDRRAVFQPFSAGPRNCLGRNLAYAEMKLILARCVFNFDFTPGTNAHRWFDQQTYLLWEKPPLMLKVSERS